MGEDEQGGGEHEWGWADDGSSSSSTIELLAGGSSSGQFEKNKTKPKKNHKHGTSIKHGQQQHFVVSGDGGGGCWRDGGGDGAKIKKRDEGGTKRGSRKTGCVGKIKVCDNNPQLDVWSSCFTHAGSSSPPISPSLPPPPQLPTSSLSPPRSPQSSLLSHPEQSAPSRRSSAAENSGGRSRGHLECTNCRVRTTPQWRYIYNDPVCNACYMRARKLKMGTRPPKPAKGGKEAAVGHEGDVVGGKGKRMR
eukprot:GHVS01105352.1.p1 GENE.GHVS01105352.1~~GHVS01105352.1.p1  ORF type:complete len:249 (-),score=77.74 GHVS01105352.1:11-757(-)